MRHGASHCGSPGTARSAHRDRRRTNVGRRRPWPYPDFLCPKSDGPHLGSRKKWRCSGIELGLFSAIGPNALILGEACLEDSIYQGLRPLFLLLISHYSLFLSVSIRKGLNDYYDYWLGYLFFNRVNNHNRHIRNTRFYYHSELIRCHRALFSMSNTYPDTSKIRLYNKVPPQ